MDVLKFLPSSSVFSAIDNNKNIQRSLRYFTKSVLQRRVKCLQMRRETGL